ncbi:MAG: hypothetical protein RIR55_742 [Bacteroidota bacterium]
MCKVLFLLFGLSFNYLYAQNKAEDINEEQSINTLIDWRLRMETSPPLLNATTNVLHSMAQYYGRHIGWSLRGNKESATLINGISWESPLKNWSLYDLYSGLQSEIHVSQSLMSNAFSELGYIAKEEARFLNTDIRQNKKLLTVGTGFSNAIFSNRIQVHYNSEFKENKWQYAIGASFQQSPVGLFSNGYHNSVGAVVVVQKSFINKRRLSISLIWNWADQGKSATTVNEMLLLSQNRNYNPSWGWYRHQLYFPNSKQTNAPIVSIQYQKKWDEYKTLSISNALIVGVQSQSSLGWTKSADPRPDYYRYLPSYIKDSAMRMSLTQWDIQHPENLQIQFDKLEQINKGTADKRAFYIVSQQNEKLLMLHGAFIFTNRVHNTFGYQLGAQYAVDQIHYFNTIKDLIGGSYFYNYNSWINDGGVELNFQNDIDHPNRKVIQGGQWGADYAMRSLQFKPWIQFDKEWPVLTTRLALGYGIEAINREGFNENGLFQGSSKGVSNYIFTPSWSFRQGVNYRFNGRVSFNSILFGKWIAPSYDQMFINPEMTSIASPYQQTSLHYGVDLGFQYHAPAIKIITSIYWKRISNQSIHKMFYHDGYASFVYGIAGNINELYSGIEASIELNLLPNITLSFASSFQQGNYETDPSYQLLFVNDLHLLESGLLHLKQMVSSNSPGIVNSLAVKYQPYSTLQLNIAILVAQNRPVSIDVFRRSDLVQHKIDAISWNAISAAHYLSDNSFLNASVFKSFQLKKSSRSNACRIGLSVNNALNHFLPLIAYEQTRFDYLHFDINKYAPKYLIDQGVTYNLHFQFSFQ